MAGLGSGFQIRVTPDHLRQIAGDVRTNLSKFETQWNDLRERVDRTQAYWTGKGADVKRKELTTLNKDVERMILRLKEYHTDLLEMAGIYDEAERNNKDQADLLPIDLIF